MRREHYKAVKLFLQHGGFLICFGGLVFFGCPIQKLLGMPCPGCGLTRAWICFFAGQWKAALEYHPLFLASPAVLFLATHGDSCLKVNFGKLRLLLLTFISLLFLGCYLYRMPFLCAKFY